MKKLVGILYLSWYFYKTYLKPAIYTLIPMENGCGWEKKKLKLFQIY